MSKKNGKKRVVPSQIMIAKRRSGVMDMIVKGIKDRNQMAARLNVSFATVDSDLAWLYAKCTEEDKERKLALRNIRAEQLEYLYRTLVYDYEKSKQAQKEIIVTKTPEKCGLCKNGFLNETDWCEHCDGTGKVIVETVTTKIKEKVGDVSLLAEAGKNLERLIKMAGLNPDPKMKIDLNESKIHTHVIANQPIPPELLLEAIGVVEKLKLIRDQPIQEISVIDAKSENVE